MLEASRSATRSHLTLEQGWVVLPSFNSLLFLWLAGTVLEWQRLLWKDLTWHFRKLSCACVACESHCTPKAGAWDRNTASETCLKKTPKTQPNPTNSPQTPRKYSCFEDLILCGVVPGRCKGLCAGAMMTSCKRGGWCGWLPWGWRCAAQMWPLSGFGSGSGEYLTFPWHSVAMCGEMS